MRRVGVDVSEINKLLKMHRTMADMMKAMGSGKRGIGQALGSMFGLGGGGMPVGCPPAAGDAGADPEQIEEMEKQFGGKLPPMPPGLGGGMPKLPGLPGLGGRSSPASAAACRSGRRNDDLVRASRRS